MHVSTLAKFATERLSNEAYSVSPIDCGCHAEVTARLDVLLGKFIVEGIASLTQSSLKYSSRSAACRHGEFDRLLSIIDLKRHRQKAPALSCHLPLATSVPSEKDSSHDESES